MNKKQKRKGISLVEVLLSLVVLAIIIGLAVNLYSKNEASRNNTELLNEVATIKEAVISLSQGRVKDMLKINNKVLINSGLIPNKFINKDGTKLIAPNKNDIDIAPNDSYGNGIYIRNMTQKQCIQLLTTVDYSSYDFIQVAHIMFGYGQKWFTPPTVGNISGTCGYNNKLNTVILVFNLHKE